MDLRRFSPMLFLDEKLDFYLWCYSVVEADPFEVVDTEPQNVCINAPFVAS